MTKKYLSLDDFAAVSGRNSSQLKKWVRQFEFPSYESADGSTLYSLSDLKLLTPELVDSREELPLRPQVISFFSGCGGLDLGFERSGFGVKFANDFFIDAARSYAKNLGPIDPRSIYEVDEKTVGAADVLLAGFPCQPFSNAGSRRGIADPRGTLFWETLRFVKEAKPRVLVFENVRGLLSMKNQDGSSLIEAIEGELDSAGYSSVHKLVNTALYGVPQNRWRVVIVAVKKELNLPKFDFDWIEQQSGGTVGDVLGKPEIKNDVNNVHWPLSPQAVHLLPHIPEGGSWKSVPYELLPDRLKKIRDNMRRYHSPNFFRRFARNEVMGTVTASATPENSGILHPTEPRRYTVREVARFQTFPDTFVFQGSIASQYKQIGNAVPPEFATRLARAIGIRYFDEVEYHDE